MRKTIAAMMLALCAFGATADNPASDPETAKEQTTTTVETVYYMEVVATRNGASKSAVTTLDYGRIMPARLGIREDDLRRATQNMSFSSPVDALNYLSMRGWHLVDTYTVALAGSSATHYVMSMSTANPKDVTDSIMKK